MKTSTTIQLLLSIYNGTAQLDANGNLLFGGEDIRHALDLGLITTTGLNPEKAQNMVGVYELTVKGEEVVGQILVFATKLKNELIFKKVGL